MADTAMLRGELADGSIRFAFVDAASRYASPQVCQFRFSATLAPYHSTAEARAALEAAGATLIAEVRR